MNLENNSLENHPEWIPTEEQRAAGITETDLMRENPPPEEEPQTLEECRPVDEYGSKIPIDEWTVNDLGCFPDSMKDWLIKKLLGHHNGEESPGVRLLREMEPSQIAQNPRVANAKMGEIAEKMGITPMRT